MSDGARRQCAAVKMTRGVSTIPVQNPEPWASRESTITVSSACAASSADSPTIARAGVAASANAANVNAMWAFN
jgi:hypothetical protein